MNNRHRLSLVLMILVLSTIIAAPTNVLAVVLPAFDVTISPSILNIGQGASGSALVTVTFYGDYGRPVELGVTGLPSGVGVTFGSNPIIPMTGGSPTTSAYFIVGANTPAGSYRLTLSGNSGSGGEYHTFPFTLIVTSSGPSDFSLGVSPSSLSVQQGGFGQATLTVYPIGSFSSMVYLSSMGSPSGVVVSFSPNQIITAPGGQPNSIVSVTVGSGVPTGTYSITLNGVSSAGGRSHGCTLTLRVSSPGPPPDFSIIVSPTSLVAEQGGSASATVTLTSIARFSSIVTLSASGVSPYVFDDVQFTPNIVNVPLGGSASSVISITFRDSAKAGAYSITLSGTGNGLARSTTLTATVSQRAPQDFSFFSSSSSLGLNQGASATLTLYASSVNGFSSTITFSASWTGTSPTGVSLANPGPIVLNSGGSASASLAFSANAQASTGTYALKVIARSGALNHILDVAIQILSGGDFSIGLSTPQVTMSRGAHVTVVVNVQSLGSFSSPVSLTSSASGAVSLGYSVNPVTPPPAGNAASQITVEASSNAPIGTQEFTLTGISGGLSHDVSLILTIREAAPDFSIAASPSALLVPQGFSGSSAISINSQEGFSSDLQLSAAWLTFAPDGITFTLPSTIVPMANSYAQSVLRVSVQPGTSTGSYTLRIRAQSGSLSHTVDVTVQVSASPITTTITTTRTTIETEISTYAIPAVILISILAVVYFVRSRRRS